MTESASTSAPPQTPPPFTFVWVRREDPETGKRIERGPVLVTSSDEHYVWVSFRSAPDVSHPVKLENIITVPDDDPRWNDEEVMEIYNFFVALVRERASAQPASPAASMEEQKSFEEINAEILESSIKSKKPTGQQQQSESGGNNNNTNHSGPPSPARAGRPKEDLLGDNEDTDNKKRSPEYQRERQLCANLMRWKAKMKKVHWGREPTLVDVGNDPRASAWWVEYLDLRQKRRDKRDLKAAKREKSGGLF